MYNISVNRNGKKFTVNRKSQKAIKNFHPPFHPLFPLRHQHWMTHGHKSVNKVYRNESSGYQRWARTTLLTGRGFLGCGWRNPSK